ncbi:MAG: hypothetical protein AAF649_12220 [Verrucomicrobiota bacterium]
MLNLIEIIKNDCIPERNCMLTVYNEQGDSGFLYFKEAQLIEVNAGKLWGKEALTTIVSWPLTSNNVTELPRGIKRTIWEPLDQIFGELVDAESGESLGQVMGSLQMDDLAENTAGPAPGLQDPITPMVKKMEDLPGFLAVYKEYGSELRQLSGGIPSTTLSTDWFLQFTARTKEMGEGLGAGMLREWYIEIEECRVWFIQIEEASLYIFSSVEVMVDEFETALAEILL